ncbi:MAG: proline dehydrogenase family protein, partial [Stellaceae bacterium]
MSFVHREAPALPTPLRAAILSAYREDETAVVERLLAVAELAPDALDRIAERARGLVGEVRRQRLGKGGLDAFLHEYALSSKEGIVLMCLAEALLRIPDAETVDRLIRDKLGPADWSQHLGQSDSLFVNASTWALMLTGRLMRSDREVGDLGGVLKRLVARSGEPVVRQAVTAAMRILGRQFVMGRTIAEALERARPAEKQGYRHSYDMLGEAARTAADARRYFESYEAAITAIGAAGGGADAFAAPGISVKLSALHPRYEETQRERAIQELTSLVLSLARHAKAKGIGFTIDAEESERLDLSLDIIEALALDPALAGWDGFGLAIQAYQKRCLPL